MKDSALKKAAVAGIILAGCMWGSVGAFVRYLLAVHRIFLRVPVQLLL